MVAQVEKMSWRDTGWGRRPAARSTDVLKVGYKKQLSAGQPMHLMCSSCRSSSCVRRGPLSTERARLKFSAGAGSS